MKQIILTAEQLTKLNLKADAEPTVIDTTINDLVAKAAKVDQLTTDLAAANTAKATATTEKEAAEKKYNDLVAKTADDSVTAQLATAVTEKKITKELSAVYAEQFKGKPDVLKTVLAATKPYVSVVETIDASKIDYSGNPELKELMAKSGQELWTSGKLDRLKALNADAYKIKYEEAFGKEEVVTE